MTDLDAFISDVAKSQLGWPDSLVWTYHATRRLLADGVPGDLVECGVAAGCHPAVMARACIDAGETRTVRLFDSFQGLPHGGVRDREWNAAYGDGSGRLEPTGVAACSLDDVIANLYRWSGSEDEGYRIDDATGAGVSIAGLIYSLTKGWFQDTVPVASAHMGPIAFLRLDGDLYDSTLTCLRHLWPLVSPGGILVVDDMNLDGCRAAVTHYFHSELRLGVLAPEWTPITDSGDMYTVKP